MPVSDPAMVTKTHHEGPSGTDPAGGNVPVVEETVAAAASALLTTKHTELPPTLDAAPPVESIEIGEIQVLEPVRHEDGKDSAGRLDRAEEIMPDSAAVMSSTEPAGEVDRRQLQLSTPSQSPKHFQQPVRLSVCLIA